MVLAIHGMTTRTMIFEDLLCRSSFLHKKRRERDEDSRSPTNIEIGGLYITNIIMYEKTAEETVSPFRNARRGRCTLQAECKLLVYRDII